MPSISGTFEVDLQTESLSSVASESGIARMSLDKRYQGALDATGKGEMLSAMGGMQGSAGYVALERVEGTLDGRSGAFFLQHSGSMARGIPSLRVTVVPDSGTNELAGLRGDLAIRRADGLHFYDFDYSLDQSD